MLLNSARCHAVVIGGGLAGASSAYSLAKRGWEVTLLESRSAIAQQGSGHRQAVLNFRGSLDPESVVYRFRLRGYQHSLRYLEQVKDETLWVQSGVLQLAHSNKRVKRHRSMTEFGLNAEGLMKPVTAREASEISGLTLQYSGLYIPSGGWVNMPRLCEKLLDDQKIKVKLGQSAVVLKWQPAVKKWVILDKHGLDIDTAPVVVIANAVGANQFLQSTYLPIRCIRGQTTMMRASEKTLSLKSVIHAGCCISPACEGTHTLGSTFIRDDRCTVVRASDHRSNLEKLRRCLPSLYHDLGMGIDPVLGHAAVRATSPDHLPIVGALPNYDVFKASGRVSYYPNLYVNTAHGSFGLSYCFLSSEILAKIMHCESDPVVCDFSKLLSPSRFLEGPHALITSPKEKNRVFDMPSRHKVETVF